jgi:ribosomal protein L11 methyltransferase
MYFWRKRAAAKWLAAHEEKLELRFGSRLVLVAAPGKRQTQLEIVCMRKGEARELVQDFGGTIESVPRDWLARSARMQQGAPLRIGKRLMVQREAARDFTHGGPQTLVIPAEAAFGTGEHATTAMSLRLLEQISRPIQPGWSCADLGTGSGILALAARRFGAGMVEAIDHDPRAISTAERNAKRNRIRGISFHVADVTKWRAARQKCDVITANLFSELLIQVLPTMRRSLRMGGKMVLSGIMRSQERSVLLALRRNRFQVEIVRRRGKWIALLAKL